MKKLNKNFLIGAIVILIIGVGVLLFEIYEARKNKNTYNPNTPNVNGSGETEYKVNIDAKDCLSKEETDKLMDWGAYKDNEKMIYIDNNKEHPIQVWKVKIREGQDGTGLMQMFMRDKNKIVEKITDDELMREILEGQYGSAIEMGGNVATMILSNHLDEVREQTKDWLNN